MRHCERTNYKGYHLSGEHHRKMAFSIEALQCKSKLSNLRSREFVKKIFFPEMMPRDDEPIFQSATHNFREAVQSVITKLKRVKGQHVKTAPKETNDLEGVTASEDTNEEGFVEVNLSQ